MLSRPTYRYLASARPIRVEVGQFPGLDPSPLDEPVDLLAPDPDGPTPRLRPGIGQYDVGDRLTVLDQGANGVHGEPQLPGDLGNAQPFISGRLIRHRLEW